VEAAAQEQREDDQTVEVDQHLQLLDPQLLEQAEVVLGVQMLVVAQAVLVAAVLVDLVLEQQEQLTRVVVVVEAVLVAQVEQAVQVS
jgi:hypothetical protein